MVPPKKATSCFFFFSLSLVSAFDDLDDCLELIPSGHFNSFTGLSQQQFTIPYHF